MACAKPSVTFSIQGSGVNEICEDGIHCIECRKQTAENLADAFRKLKSEDLREKLGTNAANKATEEYTFCIFENRLKTILNMRSI